MPGSEGEGAVVGRIVGLWRDPVKSLAGEPVQENAGPVHLVTTAALDSLGAVAGSPVEPERLRPNLLIDAGSEREESWTDRQLSVGNAGLRVTRGTERCVMIGHEHSDASEAAVSARHDRPVE
jgi:uncharacterized protein YcbX